MTKNWLRTIYNCYKDQVICAAVDSVATESKSGKPWDEGQVDFNDRYVKVSDLEKLESEGRSEDNAEWICSGGVVDFNEVELYDLMDDGEQWVEVEKFVDGEFVEGKFLEALENDFKVMVEEHELV